MKANEARGPQGPRNDRVASSLDFCTASYIPDMDIKKPETQKCQKAQIKKMVGHQKYALSAKGPGKEQHNKTKKHLDSNFSTPAI